MKYTKITQRNAQRAKALLLRLNLLDNSRTVIHSRSYVYFPTLNIMQAKDIKLIGGVGGSIVQRKDKRNAATPTYEGQLKKAIGKEYDKLSKGYDQMGDIALIEFDGSSKNERMVAKILMYHNRSIKTVLAKAGAVSGKYRVRRVRYVAGIRNYIANHRENGCTFRFDIRKVYFSNRLSFERSRIVRLSKKRENIIVMFAGVGPFAIEIGKSNKRSNVIGIEANKFGYKYMLENISINKTANVKAVLGDVAKVSQNYRNFADRIIMPLPWSSLKYLDDAYKVAKKNATVHIYAFTNSEGAVENVYNSIKKHSKKKNYKIRMLNKRIVRPYSKNEVEIVIDYKIIK